MTDANRRFPRNLRDPDQIFYLETRGKNDGSPESEVWFVNNSEHTLTSVRSNSGGFATEDDTVVHMTPNPKRGVYQHVKPGEAVLVDHYSRMLDSDYVISWGVSIQSPEFGLLGLSSEPAKGVSPDMALYCLPLPEEMKDSDNPEELVSPALVAKAYVARTGRALPPHTVWNAPDLRADFQTTVRLADVRLAPSGLELIRKVRDGKLAHYDFKDANSVTIFQTQDENRALEFLRNL